MAVNDPGGSRTRDLRIKSPLLYQLSYRVDQSYAPKSNGRRHRWRGSLLRWHDR